MHGKLFCLDCDFLKPNIKLWLVCRVDVFTLNIFNLKKKTTIKYALTIIKSPVCNWRRIKIAAILSSSWNTSPIWSSDSSGVCKKINQKFNVWWNKKKHLIIFLGKRRHSDKQKQQSLSISVSLYLSVLLIATNWINTQTRS